MSVIAATNIRHSRFILSQYRQKQQSFCTILLFVFKKKLILKGKSYIMTSNTWKQ